MKKTLLLSLVSVLSCSVAFADTKATVVETITPVSPWGLEASVVSVYATGNFIGNSTKRFNLAGPELTLVYNKNKNHAFTLRGSALYGRHGNAGVDYDGYPRPLAKLDLMLMPGYRYTHSVAPRTSVYGGFNVGVIFTDVNKHHHYIINGGGEESEWGLAASAELGVRYDIDTNWDVFAAYQLSGDTARPTIDTMGKQRGQMYHGFRVGIGHRF